MSATRCLGAFLASSLLANACARAPAPPSDPFAGRWVDLSYDFSGETIYWPTSKPFSLEVVSAQRTAAGYYYAANNFCAAEHGGTHLDAPVHLAEGKQTSDQIPLSRLIGAAAVVDVTADAASSPEYVIPVAALEGWERRNGRIADGAIVLFRTGWGARWPDRERYLGTAKTGSAGVAELHFPGIAPSTARWLANERRVGAVGIDTASIDPGQSKTFDTHQILFAANIPAFENVANLETLPERGAHVVALPMKIKGGSGGPLRIVALIGEPPR